MHLDELNEVREPFPEEAYDLISGYVTHGSLTSPDQFDLMQLLPRPRRA